MGTVGTSLPSPSESLYFVPPGRCPPGRLKVGTGGNPGARPSRPSLRSNHPGSGAISCPSPPKTPRECGPLPPARRADWASRPQPNATVQPAARAIHAALAAIRAARPFIQRQAPGEGVGEGAGGVGAEQAPGQLRRRRRSLRSWRRKLLNAAARCERRSHGTQPKGPPGMAGGPGFVLVAGVRLRVALRPVRQGAGDRQGTLGRGRAHRSRPGHPRSAQGVPRTSVRPLPRWWAAWQGFWPRSGPPP